MFDKLTIEDSTSEADKYNDLRAWQESQQCCFCGNDLDENCIADIVQTVTRLDA